MRSEGATAAQIAPEVGLSESAVAKQARDPRTVTLIQRLKSQHEPQLCRTFAKSLNGIEKDVSNIDPDVRRHARSQLLKVITAGEPPLARIEAGGNTGGDFTLEELIVSYRRATIHVP